MPKWHLIVGLLLPAALLGCARYQPPAEYFRKSNVDALKAAFGSAAESSSSAATPAAVAKPTGWATLKGTFKLNGAAPPREPVPVTKDHEVCAPGGKQALSEKLVVDSASGGIKDVLIYLATKYPAGDANWEHSDYAAQRDATLDFDQKNCIFLSHMFAVRSTQKVKVLNSDPVGHNTNISGGGKAGASNNNIPAGSYSMYAPGGEAPEPFAVACSIHPWMSANMISRDSPYFAVTKPDGTFEIKNVPAGVPLEFRVWQERSKFLQDVSVNGKAEKWSKGRLKLTLQPDEQKSLDVVVDAAAFSK
jgi:hypothetical protein